MQEGNLADRAQLEGFEGLDRELLTEINLLLDALANPLILAADRLARLAKGEVPPKLTEEFSGELEHLKNSLNSCIDVMVACPCSDRRS